MSSDANDDDDAVAGPRQAEALAALLPLLEDMPPDQASRVLDNAQALIALVPLLDQMPDDAVWALVEHLETADDVTRQDLVDRLLKLGDANAP